MKNLFFSLMIILCFVSVGANAQNKNSSSTLESELKKECGRSGEGSDFLIIEEGIVNYINSDNSLIITVEDKSKIVNLTAISPETNKNKINGFLTKRLLNKNVELNITLSDINKNQHFATIIESGKDISRYLIENGIAKYQETEGLLDYTSCVYQQIEKKAKEEKLGIWAK